MEKIRMLVVRFAMENRGWGYTKIQGALGNLRHRVGRETIADTLKENGIEPAPERVKEDDVAGVLASALGGIAAADFFTVEGWTRKGLQRYIVFFIFELSQRRGPIPAVATPPSAFSLAPSL